MIVTIDFLFIQLSLVSSETPSKIQSTLKEVEEFSRQLSILKEQYSELKAKIPAHQVAVDAFLEKIKPHLDLIQQLELEQSYLWCLKLVEDHRYYLHKIALS